MTDEKRIRNFAKAFGLDVFEFTHPDCICDHAKKAGATKSIGFEYGKKPKKQYANLNFEIDSKGKCLGYSTDCIDSFKKRKK